MSKDTIFKNKKPKQSHSHFQSSPRFMPLNVNALIERMKDDIRNASSAPHAVRLLKNKYKNVSVFLIIKAVHDVFEVDHEMIGKLL